MTPRARRSIAALKRTAPAIRDWTWPVAAVCGPPMKITRKRRNTASGERAHHDRSAPEHPQRLILGIDPEDRQPVAADIGRDRREKSGVAGLGVGADRDVVEGDRELARLDDRLQGVGEPRDDLHLQRGLAVVGPKARGRVGDLGGRRPAHDPRAEALEPALGAGEVLVGVDLAVADHHVGLAAQDRTYELRDVGGLVLVVGIGVDDHVGAELESGVQPGLEARRQSLVVGQADDVVDAAVAGRPRSCRRSTRHR